MDWSAPPPRQTGLRVAGHRGGDHGVGKREVTVELSQGERPFRIFFTADLTLDVSGDALGVLTLLPAMACGGVHIDGRVSPRLLEGLKQVQEIFRFWDVHASPMPVGFRIVDVDARPARPARRRRARRRSGRGVAAFFTAGVDSLYTALKHRDEIDTLLYVHGFDIGLGAQSLRDIVGQRLHQAADMLGMRLVDVVSDLRRFSDLYVPWPFYHVEALAGVALLLRRHVRKVYIPATLTYANLAPVGSHPLVDPLWSTEEVQFVHDGCEATRDEKLELIGARQPEVLRHLRVCHMSPGDAYNCGRCEKCLRTMVALRVTGLDRWASSFPPLDLGRLPSVHLPVNSFTWRRLRRRAEQAGNQAELVNALDSLLR